MKDIKIKDAAFFPKPPAFYKELPTARAMGEAAAEYMAGWEFNGLLIMASAGVYDDGRAIEAKTIINWQKLPTQGEL